jgi:hypothetical protein
MKNCIMHFQPTNSCDDTDLFCGFCILKICGWSFLQTDAAGAVNPANIRTLWYDSAYNSDPTVGAVVPPPNRPAGSGTTNPGGVPHPAYAP